MGSDEQQAVSQPGQPPVPATRQEIATGQNGAVGLHRSPPRALAPVASATSVLALGTLAVGALAIGAFAFGRLAIGQLALSRTRLPTSQSDQRRVARLIIADLWIEHLHDG